MRHPVSEEAMKDLRLRIELQHRRRIGVLDAVELHSVLPQLSSLVLTVLGVRCPTRNAEYYLLHTLRQVSTDACKLQLKTAE